MQKTNDVPLFIYNNWASLESTLLLHGPESNRAPVQGPKASLPSSWILALDPFQMYRDFLEKEGKRHAPAEKPRKYPTVFLVFMPLHFVIELQPVLYQWRLCQPVRRRLLIAYWKMERCIWNPMFLHPLLWVLIPENGRNWISISWWYQQAVLRSRVASIICQSTALLHLHCLSMSFWSVPRIPNSFF